MYLGMVMMKKLKQGFHMFSFKHNKIFFLESPIAGTSLMSKQIVMGSFSTHWFLFLVGKRLKVNSENVTKIRS